MALSAAKIVYEPPNDSAAKLQLFYNVNFKIPALECRDLFASSSSSIILAWEWEVSLDFKSRHSSLAKLPVVAAYWEDFS